MNNPLRGEKGAKRRRRPACGAPVNHISIDEEVDDAFAAPRVRIKKRDPFSLLSRVFLPT